LRAKLWLGAANAWIISSGVAVVLAAASQQLFSEAGFGRDCRSCVACEVGTEAAGPPPDGVGVTG
jgi:hypothetical protein